MLLYLEPNETLTGIKSAQLIPHGDTVRQGNSVELYILLPRGFKRSVQNMNLLAVNRDGDTISVPVGSAEEQLSGYKFQKLYPTEMTYGLVSGDFYHYLKIEIPGDSEVLSKGNSTITFTLLASLIDNVSNITYRYAPQFKMFVEKTYEDYKSELTKSEYESLLEKIAIKQTQYNYFHIEEEYITDGTTANIDSLTPEQQDSYACLMFNSELGVLYGKLSFDLSRFTEQDTLIASFDSSAFEMKEVSQTFGTSSNSDIQVKVVQEYTYYIGNVEVSEDDQYSRKEPKRISIYLVDVNSSLGDQVIQFSAPIGLKLIADIDNAADLDLDIPLAFKITSITTETDALGMNSLTMTILANRSDLDPNRFILGRWLLTVYKSLSLEGKHKAWGPKMKWKAEGKSTTISHQGYYYTVKFSFGERKVRTHRARHTERQPSLPYIRMFLRYRYGENINNYHYDETTDSFVMVVNVRSGEQHFIKVIAE